MSLLKVNEVQNYNGSSLTLTASTVSTSAQLNTGGNVSVTGSINVSDDSTTRSNLGLGTIATQAADNVAITGGTIGGVTLGGDVAMASSGLTVRNITNVALGSDQELGSSTTLTTFFSPTYTPLFSGSKVQGILTLVGAVWNTASGNGLKRLRIEFTGSGITDYTTVDADNLGGQDYGNSGIEIGIHQSIVGGLITTTTTDLITANVKAQNKVNAATTKWKFLGDGTTAETFFTWIEYK